MTSATSSDSTGAWAGISLVLTAAALVLLFAVVPHDVTGDGYARFGKLNALLIDGTAHGAPYSYVGPLFAAAFWVLDDPESRLWWCARFNVLVLAIGVAASWWALRRDLPRTERSAFVLLLAATGMMPNALRDFYGEAFSTITVGTGLLLVAVRGLWFGWIPVMLGVANSPACVGGLGCVAIWRFWRSRRLDAFWGLVGALAIMLVENLLTRGGPFETGYLGNHGLVTAAMPFSGKAGFSYPLLLGVLSLLFSFGKGLLFFAPALGLVPAAWRSHPALGTLFELSIAFLVGLLIVFAQWWAWYGGWKWGPRFLLFAVYPSSLALAIGLGMPSNATRALTTIGVTIWTVWVGVSGAVFDLDGLGLCIENGYALEHLCWYVPEYSPLLRHFVLPPGELALWQQAWMLFAVLVASVLIGGVPWLNRRPAIHHRVP